MGMPTNSPIMRGRLLSEVVSVVVTPLDTTLAEVMGKLPRLAPEPSADARVDEAEVTVVEVTASGV
jgi:hypothetical protein